MNTTEAKELIETYAKVSGKMMERDGEVAPVAFFSCKQGVATVDIRDILSGTAEEKDFKKDAGFEALRYLLKEEDADWYLLIVEAWTVEITNEKKSLDEARKDMPTDLEHYQGRKECVWFQFEDHENGQIIARRMIERDKDGKGKLGPLQFIPTNKAEPVEGRMTGMLHPRGRKH